MNPIRVLQWGLGAMGSGMARLMLTKPGLQIVAAVDERPDFVGKDLGDVLGAGKRLGVVVTNQPESVLKKEKRRYRVDRYYQLAEGTGQRPAQNIDCRDKLYFHCRRNGRCPGAKS